MALITAVSLPGHKLLSVDVYDWKATLLAHVNSNAAGNATATVANGADVVAVVHRQGAADEVSWKHFNPDGSLSPANNKPLAFVNIGAVPAGGSVTYYKGNSLGQAIAATAKKTIDSAGATFTGDFDHSAGTVRLPIVAGEGGWFEVRNAAGTVTACYQMIHAGGKLTGPYRAVTFEPINQPYAAFFIPGYPVKVWNGKSYIPVASPVKLNKGENIKLQLYWEPRGKSVPFGTPRNVIVGSSLQYDYPLDNGQDLADSGVIRVVAHMEGGNFVFRTSYIPNTDLEPRKTFGFDPFPFLGGDLDFNGYVGPEDTTYKNQVMADLNSPVAAVKNRAIAFIRAALTYKTNEQMLRRYCDGSLLAADGKFYLEPGTAASAGHPAIPPSGPITFAMAQAWRDACSRSFATMKAQYSWVNDTANGPTASFHNLFDTINPATGYLGQANAALKAKFASNYRLFQQFDNFLPDVSSLVNGKPSAQIGDQIYTAIQNAAKGFAAIGLVANNFNNDLSQALATGLTPLEIGKAIDPTLSNNGAIQLALGLGTKIENYARAKMLEWATKIRQLTTSYVQCYNAEQLAQQSENFNKILGFLFDGLTLLMGGAASLASIGMQAGRLMSVARNEYKLTTIFQKFKIPDPNDNTQLIRMYSDQEVEAIVAKFKNLQPSQMQAKFNEINLCEDPEFPPTDHRKAGWLSSDGPDFINLGVSDYNQSVGARANALVQAAVGANAMKFSFTVNNFLSPDGSKYNPNNAVAVSSLGEVAAKPAFAQNIRKFGAFAVLSNAVTAAIEQLIKIGKAGDNFYSWGASYGPNGNTGQTNDAAAWTAFLHSIGITSAIPLGKTLNWRGYVYVMEVTSKAVPPGSVVTTTIKRMATPF